MLTVSGPGRCHTSFIGALVRAEDRKTRRDIRHVAVGVWQVGIADEVGALAGHGVGEDPLAKRRFGDTGAEEVRRSPDRDANAAGFGGVQQLLGHRSAMRPFTVVAASGESSVIGLPAVGP